MNRPPKISKTFQGHVYDFTKLIPAKDGVPFSSKKEVMRESIEIMKTINYPFDFRCPMPPLFVHVERGEPIAWHDISACLFNAIENADGAPFEDWNPNFYWLGYRLACRNHKDTFVYHILQYEYGNNEPVRSCVCNSDSLLLLIDSLYDSEHYIKIV